MDENRKITSNSDQYNVDEIDIGSESEDAYEERSSGRQGIPTAKSKTDKVFSILTVVGVIALFAIVAVLLPSFFDGDSAISHTHRYGEWSVTENATCTEDGEMTRRCSCGKNQKKTVSAEGHSFGDWHKFIAETCLTDGEERRTCADCSAYESRAVAKTDAHIPVADEGFLPTCSSEGLSEGSHCLICEKILQEQVVLPKSDHKLNLVVMENEYCNGRQLSSVYCSDCGEYVTSYGHHYIKSVIEATCTRDGEERYTCDLCGDSYFTIVPSGGHIGGGYEMITDATCQLEGVAEQRCMVCNELIDSLYYDKNSHSYSVSLHVSGTITYKCGECGDSYSVESEAEVFTVTFKSDSLVVEVMSVAYGEKIENLPEVEKDGYRLSHWMINDGGDAIYDYGCIYEDTELVAVWEEELVLNTHESDIAVFMGVETDFAFTVIAADMSYIAQNLFVYNADDEEISYSINSIGDGKYEITSNEYESGKFYYAIAKGSLSFLGTESKEIQFSIAGEDNVNIQVGSHVKWLEYSDVYGLIDGALGKLLLTNYSFNIGDSIAIYEDNKENIVLVIDILGVSEEMGYNAYLFEVADYADAFDSFEVDFSGDLTGGELSLDPMAVETLKSEFMSSSLYRNARSAAVMWGEKMDIGIEMEDIKVSIGMDNGRVIAGITFTIELDEDWEINIIYKNVISVGFDYHISKSLSPTAIVQTTNHQTFEINLSNSRDNKIAKMNAKDAYESYKAIFEKIRDNPDYDVMTDYDKPPREVRIGGVDIPLFYGVTASITVYGEFAFEATGTVGVAFEITATQRVGIKGGSVVNSTQREITGISMLMYGKLRAECLAKLELFINVVGIGVYGDVGIGPYAEIGGAGSMGYDGHDLYMTKFSVYFDVGIRFEANVGIKCKFLGRTIADRGIEIYGKDYPFSGFPIGSKEIWLSFEEYEEEIDFVGSCDRENVIVLDKIINTAIKYQNLDDMTYSYKNPDSVYYSIISVSGYRSKVRLTNTSLSFDSIGEDVEIVLKVKVSDTIYKTVVIHYTVSHVDDCIHFLCANGFHSGGKATCTDKAICERCGLEYGDEPIGHIYSGRECTVCGQMKASEGLEYELLDDGTYMVVGIGECQDNYIVIPDKYLYIDVTAIGPSAFSSIDCLYINGIEIPSSVTTIGEQAFSGIELNTIKFQGTIEQWCNIQFESYTSNPGGYYSVRNPKFYIDGELIDKLVIPDGVTSISNYAFAGWSFLESVTLPDSITTIGNFAFYRCVSLTSITIPSSVMNIGDDAFLYCYALIEVCNKSSLNIVVGSTNNGYVGYYADQIIKDEFHSNLIYAGDYLLYCGSNYFGTPYEYLMKYLGDDSEIKYLPSRCKIWPYAFYGNTQITSVTIPPNVEIGDNAFMDCTSLTSVTLSGYGISIGDNAFKGCYSLVEVCNKSPLKILAGSEAHGGIGYYAEHIITDESDSYLKIVGDFVFYDDGANVYLVKYVGSDAEITLPDYDNGKEYSVCKEAFRDNDKITKVVIPYPVISIGDNAFMHCTSLTNVAIGNSVISIGLRAFYGCHSLTNLTIGNSVTTIENGAFMGCSSLTNITIPESLRNVGNNIFDGCNSLQYNEYNNALYLGCENNKYIMLVKAKNDNITICEMHRDTKIVCSGAFFFCKSLTNVTIGNSVLSIGNSAFESCDSLTSITIPDSVTMIGYKAFSYCGSLKSVTIGNSVSSIAAYAFDGCNSLTNAIFKNTNGWWYASSSSATRGTSISSKRLADSSTAAAYLISTYSSKYWHRTE